VTITGTFTSPKQFNVALAYVGTISSAVLDVTVYDLSTMITLNSDTTACPIVYTLVGNTTNYQQIVDGTADLKIKSTLFATSTLTVDFVVGGTVTTSSPSFILETVCPPFLGMGICPPTVHESVRQADTSYYWGIAAYMRMGNDYPRIDAPFPY
jgi:hypothetical protein